MLCKSNERKRQRERGGGGKREERVRKRRERERVKQRAREQEADRGRERKGEQRERAQREKMRDLRRNETNKYKKQIQKVCVCVLAIDTRKHMGGARLLPVYHSVSSRLQSELESIDLHEFLNRTTDPGRSCLLCASRLLNEN